MKYFLNVIEKVLWAFSLCMASAILLPNLIGHTKGIVIIYTIAVILLVLLMSSIDRHGRIVLAAIIILSSVVRLSFALLVDTPPASDFGFLYDTARAVVRGDFSNFQTAYLRNWAYQTPFVLYEALILKIFNSGCVLKILNVLYMVGTNILIYLIAKRIAGARCARTAAFLYAIYPAPILYASVLTNQHIATFFFFLAVYIVISSDKPAWGRYITAGLLLSFSNLMRSEGIILLTAFVLVASVQFLKQSGVKPKAVIAGCMVLFVASYYALTAFTSVMIIHTGINQYGVSNQKMEWKFVVGLDPVSSGCYTDRNNHILFIEDDARRRAESLKVIKSSFTDVKSVLTFLVKKNMKMWSEKETAQWSLGHIDKAREFVHGISFGELIEQVRLYDKAIYTLIWLAYFLLSLKCLVGRYRYRWQALLIAGMVCLNYAAYMLIEIQVRYRYNIMPAVFVAAALVLGTFSRDLHKKGLITDE